MDLTDDPTHGTRSWKKKLRRVIYKAEVVRLQGREPRDYARFVVTNPRIKRESVYEICRGRGDSENRIEELQHDLQIDRTSRHRFRANQFRVLLTAAAYALLQAFRSRLAKPPVASHRVGTLRLQLVKIGGRIEKSVRRYVLHLCEHHPWQWPWRRAAICWVARSP